MPYTAKQCRYFAVSAKKGKKVPSDWKEKCRKKKTKRKK